MSHRIYASDDLGLAIGAFVGGIGSLIGSYFASITPESVNIWVGTVSLALYGVANLYLIWASRREKIQRAQQLARARLEWEIEQSKREGRLPRDPDAIGGEANPSGPNVLDTRG